MEYEPTERQSHLVGLRDKRVQIFGCGGTGSHLAVTLAKLGVRKIQLTDRDVVGKENIASQMFSPVHIKQPKATALRKLLVAFTEMNEENISAYQREINIEDTEIGSESIVVLCLDNHETRKEILQYFLENEYSMSMLIDIRVGRDQYDLFMVKGPTEDDYEALLKTLEEKTVSDPCHAKISYVTNALVAQRAAGAIIDVFCEDSDKYMRVTRETGHIRDTAIITTKIEY